MVECGSDDAAVAMGSCDFAPDDSDLRALSFPGGSVDECYTLSEVESIRPRLAICCNTIDFFVHCASAALLSLLLLVCDGSVDGRPYCASVWLSTPSIFTRDVLGFVFRFPR